MKLELKHLAPYLPYGLKIMYEYKSAFSNIPNSIKIEEMDSRNIFRFYGKLPYSYVYSKPILRPLSDLTKEIEHNGEKFVPIERYSEEFESNDDYIYENMNDENNQMYWSVCKELPQYVFEWLVKHHFDVFGLIEKGLAIDINTIKTN